MRTNQANTSNSSKLYDCSNKSLLKTNQLGIEKVCLQTLPCFKL